MMGFGFLAPLLLAGAALLVVPWIIHRIRRPERQEVRFSSLMFVPNIKKEVIERRKIQHPWLMLLRMLLFLLLVLAFSRPARRERAEPVAETAGPVRHLILLDTSHSMNAGQVFSAAQKEAHGIVEELPSDAAVGVLGFDTVPTILAPLADGIAGRAAARQAIDAARIQHRATNYAAALQFAERLLYSFADTGEGEPKTVLHLVSDFQRTGVAEQGSGWRLSRRVQCRTYDVASEREPGATVTETIATLNQGSEIAVIGKVRNWSSSEEKTLTVMLAADGESKAEQQLTIAQGNASRVSFILPNTTGGALAGRLSTGSGQPGAWDRYFLWHPPEPVDVVLLQSDTPDRGWNAAWFLEHAMGEVEDGHRRWRKVAWRDLESMLAADSADVVLASGLAEFDSRAADALAAFVRDGGGLWLGLNETADSAALGSFLAAFGIEDRGVRYETFLDSRFEILGWIDFGHPLFVPFKGAQFNDFSQIRFYNYRQLRIPESSDALARGLASLDVPGQDSPVPIILESALGRGTMLLWAFSPELKWTNFPKNVKFVPLVHETVRYLAGREDVRRQFTVGETLPDKLLAPGAGEVRLVADGVETSLDPSVPLAMPGLVQIRGGPGDGWRTVAVVNLDPDEADPEKIPPREFLLKLTAGDPEPTGDFLASALPNEPSPRSIDRELGRGFLPAVLALLLLETWYAWRLSRRKRTAESASAS